MPQIVSRSMCKDVLVLSTDLGYAKRIKMPTLLRYSFPRNMGSGSHLLGCRGEGGGKDEFEQICHDGCCTFHHVGYYTRGKVDGTVTMYLFI